MAHTKPRTFPILLYYTCHVETNIACLFARLGLRTVWNDKGCVAASLDGHMRAMFGARRAFTESHCKTENVKTVPNGHEHSTC